MPYADSTLSRHRQQGGALWQGWVKAARESQRSSKRRPKSNILLSAVLYKMLYGIMHISDWFFLLLVLNAYRIVPLNKIGSWRMIDSLDLNVCKGSLAISIPSMMILPIQKKNDSLLGCWLCHSHWQRHGSLSACNILQQEQAWSCISHYSITKQVLVKQQAQSS